jgi:hypothetical protein
MRGNGLAGPTSSACYLRKADARSIPLASQPISLPHPALPWEEPWAQHREGGEHQTVPD